MRVFSLRHCLLLLFCFQPFSVPAADLFLFPSGLILTRGEAYLDWSNRFQRGTDYFNGSGDRTSLFPGGSRETYLDAVSTLSLAYGLTDTFTLYTNIPFRYRKETNTYHADAFGLGDVIAGIRFGLMRDRSDEHSVALDLSAKFPTGRSNIGFNDASQGVALTLPLGSGNSDISLAAVFRQICGSRFEFQESIQYKRRIQALSEYLASTGFSFSDSNGNVYVLPIGNLKIKWGDEIETRIGSRAKVFENVFLSVGFTYLWRLNTVVDSFMFVPAGAGTDSVVDEIVFAQSHYLSGRLDLSYRASPIWSYHVGWNHPLFGKNYPITSLAFVEGLLGDQYTIGVSYAF